MIYNKEVYIISYMYISNDDEKYNMAAAYYKRENVDWIKGQRGARSMTNTKLIIWASKITIWNTEENTKKESGINMTTTDVEFEVGKWEKSCPKIGAALLVTYQLVQGND